MALLGCGGGLPLLHPAATLPAGEVRVAAGFSANVAMAGFADAMSAATTEARTNPNVPGPPGDTTYARGALVAASVGPGLAPFGAGRVGIGGSVEGGLAYTGRAVRVDLRRSFDVARGWSLSFGAGGSAALYGHQDQVLLPNVSLNALHGWGADVPALVGFESDGGLYMLWMGARAGWEHVDISEVSSTGSMTFGAPPISLAATRFWGGGVLGFAVGFRHVHVAFEMDASYANITGNYNATPASVAGLTLAPASAVWWRF
jgi:hypothetical protein